MKSGPADPSEALLGSAEPFSHPVPGSGSLMKSGLADPSGADRLMKSGPADPSGADRLMKSGHAEPSGADRLMKSGHAEPSGADRTMQMCHAIFSQLKLQHRGVEECKMDTAMGRLFKKMQAQYTTVLEQKDAFGDAVYTDFNDWLGQTFSNQKVDPMLPTPQETFKLRLQDLYKRCFRHWVSRSQSWMSNTRITLHREVVP